MQQVSDYELELMKIIWANGGRSLYAPIAGALEAKGEAWTKNTIITLLSRLMEKGLLKTNKIGRKNEYVALVTEEAYQAAQTETFLQKLYRGDARGLVCTLIEKNMLSTEDYEELKRFWEERGEKNG